MRIHQLSTEIRPRLSTDQPFKTNVRFADFFIDGKSLYQRFEKYDLVPSLGWGRIEYQKEMIQYFLLQKPHSLLWYRTPILVCPECADLECGFLSAKLEKRGDLIIWSDFFKDHYAIKIDIGPFYFKWEPYTKVIQSTLTG